MKQRQRKTHTTDQMLRSGRYKAFAGPKRLIQLLKAMDASMILIREKMMERLRERQA